MNSNMRQNLDHAATLDNSSGSASATWNPNATSGIVHAIAGWDAAVTGNAVYSIAVAGSNICVAGDFTTNGGQARSHLACLDSANATATSWNPGAASLARTLAIGNSSIFAGGDIGMVNGWTRNNMAAISTSTGYPIAWNPNADNTINTIAIDGTTVYTGGTFTNIGGAARNRIAALDSSGNATA